MILRVNDLTCGYNKDPMEDPVIKKISFDIRQGSKVAVLGANGCGKTTLLRAMSGMLSYSGSLLLDQKEVKSCKRNEIARKITILYTDHLFGKPGDKDKEVVERCLRRNGLLDIRNKQIDELSGGQQQRVFLARTMAQETPILLLDEPTNHLDLKYRAELTDYLSEWCSDSTALPDGRKIKNTLIGVFHDINMALSVCDEFLILKDGRLIYGPESEPSKLKEPLKEAYDMDVETYMKKQLSIWSNS